jgi:hypothetical protein
MPPVHTTAALSFTGRIDVASVERRLMTNPDFVTEPGPCLIDFTEANSFDIVALLLLLAVTDSRGAHGHSTQLRLPSDPLARHILRRARFPAATEVVTQTPFRMLVEPPDLGYFGEPPPRYAGISDDADGPTASVLAYLAEQHHFGFSAYRIDQHPGKRRDHELLRMMNNEVTHWGGYAMTRLLDKVLCGDAVDVSRVLIQELLANVVEHSDSSTAVLASHMHLAPRRDVPAALTIALWDNGKSITETMRDCLRQHGNVRRWCPSMPDEFEMRTDGPQPTAGRYTSAWTPDPASSDAQLLLASLFPGITRKLADRTPAHDSLAPSEPDHGYGLFWLYKATVDHFGGSLEVRCGRTSLGLTRPDPDEPYHVQVLTGEEGLDQLSGTIVIARLPVGNA